MKRIPAIDGFRAIAILLVISFHYINNQLVNNVSSIGKILYQLTSFGWVGVDLFFVLSGFLIGSILLLHRNSPSLFKSFYIRRFVRIVPNYYLLILLFLLVTAIPFFKDNYFLAGNQVIPTWSYFAMVHNFYMASLANLGNDALSVTWSIGIEEQFYLLFPFFILLIKEKWLPCFLLVLIAVAIFCRSFFTHWIPPYVLLPCRMDAICFGIFIAWLHKNYHLEELVRKHVGKILIAMGFVMVVCAILFYQFRDLGIVRNSLFAFVFTCLIVIALGQPRSWLSRILSSKVLGWIGKISYSLYLFHYLILGIFRHAGAVFFKSGNSYQAIITTFAALAFSFLFAWLVYEFLEKPAVAFGKRYSYNRI